LVYSAARPIDLGFAIANVIWTMTGSVDLEMIGAYNPNAVSFSDDGRTLSGALGARILSSSAGDQLEIAADLLRRDPSSRRAIVQVYSCNDLGADTRDCPCLISLQFLVRGGSLHCIGYMRSQSALMLLPYDLFLLTMIHEVFSTRLALPLGSYHHFCGSLHYYRDEEETVDRVLGEHVATPSEMPCMPDEPANLWEIVSSIERSIRPGQGTHQEKLKTPDVLPTYWSTLLRVMAAGMRTRRGESCAVDELELADQLYWPIVAQRIRADVPTCTK
jgi:thymidylate synthase